MASDGYQDGKGYPDEAGYQPHPDELSTGTGPVSPEDGFAPNGPVAGSAVSEAYAPEPFMAEPTAEFAPHAMGVEAAPLAAAEPVLQLSEEDLHDEPAARYQPLIGEILMEQVGITVDQVAAALDTQAVDGGRIGEILTRNRVVTEEQLLAALATQV